MKKRRKNSPGDGGPMEWELTEVLARLPLLPLHVDAQGKALWLGPQWEAYSGLPVASLLGDAWWELIHPEDRDAAARAWTAPRRRGPLRELEYRLRTADGPYHWVLTRVTALADPDTGAVTGWVGTSLDIDTQKAVAQNADSRAVLQAEALLRERGARTRAEESERRTRVVVEVAQALARPVSLAAVLEAATEALSGAFADAGSGIWLHDPARKRLRLAASRGYSDEGRRVLAEVSEDHPSTTAEAFRRRDAVVYNLDDPRMPVLTRQLVAVAAAGASTVSVAAAPLLVAGRILGTLSLVLRGQTLDESWLETLRAVGAQVAAAVERTTLYERERAVAQRLQSALLPALDAEAILKETGLSIAHRYRSGTEGITVGGDFYDLWPLPQGPQADGPLPTARLAVVLGDVSGKGLEAAVQTSALRHTARAYAHSDPKPAQVVARVNALTVALDLLPQGFATMFFATVDAASGLVEYCSAGHESLLLLRRDGGVRLLESNAPALGLAIQEPPVTEQARMDPGSLLVLYTDGMTEARHPGTRALLGVAGLSRLGAEAMADLGAGEAADAFASSLLRRVEDYAGGRLEDDAALLVIMRPGGVATAGRDGF